MQLFQEWLPGKIVKTNTGQGIWVVEKKKSAEIEPVRAPNLITCHENNKREKQSNTGGQVHANP